jgi:hypothetical protein
MTVKPFAVTTYLCVVTLKSYWWPPCFVVVVLLCFTYHRLYLAWWVHQVVSMSVVAVSL